MTTEQFCPACCEGFQVAGTKAQECGRCGEAMHIFEKPGAC